MNLLAYLFAGLLILLGVLSFFPFPGEAGVPASEMVLGGVLLAWGGAIVLSLRVSYRGGLATLAGVVLLGIGVYVSLVPFFMDPSKFPATAGVRIAAALLFLVPAFALLALGHRIHTWKRLSAKAARLSVESESAVHKAVKPEEAEGVARPSRASGTFLDTLIEMSFTKGPHGEDLYHPYGFLFKGRVVADAALKDRIIKDHKDFVRYVFPVAVVYGLWIGMRGPLLIDLFVLLLFGALMQWRQKRLVHGLPVYGQRPGRQEVMSRMGRLYPSWLKRVIIVNGFVLVAMAAAMPWLMRRPLVEIAELVAIAGGVGVACVLLGVLLLRAGKVS